MDLYLTLNHIDSNVPSLKLIKNLLGLGFGIYNEMSQKGYKNFSIDSINRFNFINSGNEATIQKFTSQQSLISKFKLCWLVFKGISFTLDPSIGYLFNNFSKMDDIYVTNCVVLPTVTSTSHNTFRNICCKTTSVTPVDYLIVY
ncbi:hypothetical protein ACTFIT_002816 [Dictyostelium discoideum]